MITRTRPVWAEISRSRLMKNFRAVQAAAGSGVVAVVKANAYGHGSPQCAPILAEAGAQWLGVTSVDEGILVREAVKAAPETPEILVMCGVWQGEAEAVFNHQLTPVVWEPYHLDLLEAEAARRAAPNNTINMHLEIDTGMSRQGVASGDALAALLARLKNSPLQLTGVMTHLACAEVADSAMNGRQVQEFSLAVQQVAAAGLQPKWIHAGNSSAVDTGVELPAVGALAELFGARPMPRTGLALYGYTLPVVYEGKSGHGILAQSLQPALEWKTRIVSLRDVPAGATIGYSATYAAPKNMRLALLPVGYADGYRRELSCTDTKPGGAVLVRGQRAPIVGRVSMDLTIVDVSNIAGAAIGDEVVLIGSQGAEKIGADELARIAGTIPYEILCGISDRVPRKVVE